jgi:hypothetical protein
MSIGIIQNLIGENLRDFVRSEGDAAPIAGTALKHLTIAGIRFLQQFHVVSGRVRGFSDLIAGISAVRVAQVKSGA